MASPDRSALRRRLAWLAASFALLALAGLAIWLARPNESDSVPAPPPPAPAPPPPAPPIAALTREDLVAAAQVALQPPLAAAEGGRAPAIAGQRFAVVLPVRCPEALGAASGAHLTYNYDTVQAAVTLTARPRSWLGTPLAGVAEPARAYDAVEGFWIDPLPLASPICARTPPPAAALEAPKAAGAEPEADKEAEAEAAKSAPAPTPNVGLAMFYEAGGSRTAQRRDRPYRVTRKAPPPTGAAPYNLVLSGRVAPFESAPVIRCQAADGEPPACLIAATIDRVAFVAAETGEVLAEWVR